MSEHDLATIEWTALIWGGALVLGLAGYLWEAVWKWIENRRQ